MDDLFGLLLSLLAVAAPLCLAWWLIGRKARLGAKVLRGSRPHR